MTALNPSVLATVAGIGLLTSAILKFIVVRQSMNAAHCRRTLCSDSLALPFASTTAIAASILVFSDA